MALRSTQQFINEHHNEGLSIAALLRLATRVRRLYCQPRHAQNRELWAFAPTVLEGMTTQLRLQL
jgi:hypothetical protein